MSTRGRQSPLAASRGLTFGEMLVVLAVVLLLASMFVISSQYVIVRSKVSRALHDERETIGRIDQYVADNLQIPPEQKGLAALLHSPSGMSYLTTLPADPFATGENGPQTFQYFANLANNHQCLVVSVGPDGVSDIAPAIEERRHEAGPRLSSAARRYLFVNPSDAEAFIIQHSYDPTNGSVSSGDIIKSYGYSGL